MNDRSVLHRLGLMGMGLLVTLAVLEVAVRIFHPQPCYRDLIYPSEKTGFTLQPDVRGRATNHFGEFDTPLEANHEGFRDQNHPLIKPADVFRIAFLGDSFTMAEQVEEQETFVRRVEAYLRACGESRLKRVECMNFGINGYDTQQEALCYENFVRPYKPDMVVLVMYPHNDFSGNLFYTSDTKFGRPYFRLENGQLRKIEADKAVLWDNYQKAQRQHRIHWYNSLQIYNFQKEMLHAIRDRFRKKRDHSVYKLDLHDPKSVDGFWKRFGIGRYRYYAMPITDPYVRDVDEITHLLLRRLQSMVRADGGRFCVVMLPAEENLFPEKWPTTAKHYPGLEQFQVDFNRPFQRVMEFLPEATMRGDVLDPRPELRELSKEKSLFLKHDFHYGPWGQESVARVLTPWIVARLKSK